MRPAGCPLHLLLLHHAFADHLVHRRFNEGRADRLAVSVAFAEVRDELLIVADVGLEEDSQTESGERFLPPPSNPLRMSSFLSPKFGAQPHTRLVTARSFQTALSLAVSKYSSISSSVLPLVSGRKNAAVTKEITVQPAQKKNIAE